MIIPACGVKGTQKGGTTALMNLIKLHPLIVKSKSFEAHFFDYDKAVKAVRDLDFIPDETLCDLRISYAFQHFGVRNLTEHPELLSFEKTPAYILEEGTPARIKAITPW